MLRGHNSDLTVRSDVQHISNPRNVGAITACSVNHILYGTDQR